MAERKDTFKITGSQVSNKELWSEEIIRETEHYFQSEIQQDQRSSWLLATIGVLIAVWISLEIAILDKGYNISQPLLISSLVAFLLSGAFSIFNLMPLIGTRYIKDILGRKYKNESKLDPSQLIAQRFRHDQSWSRQSLETRLGYHFRGHYLRNLRKAYNVYWSAVFLMIGTLLLASSVIGLVFFS